MHYFIMNLMFA